MLGDPRESSRCSSTFDQRADASPTTASSRPVSRQDGDARVTISTAAPGVSSEAGRKLFQPFFTTRNRGGGSRTRHLRDIVRRYGGDIGLAPPQEGGTVACDASARVGDGAGGAAVVTRGKRILVVDDEEVIRDVLATLLEKEGYDVGVASTAGEALTMFEAEPYDVVLLDLMLPDRPGLELMREIRRNDPDAVVVIVDRVLVDRRRHRGHARRRVSLHSQALPETGSADHGSQGPEARRLTEGEPPAKEETPSATAWVASSASQRPCAVFDLVGGSRGPSKSTILVEGESGTGKSSSPARSTRTRRAWARRS